MNAGKKNKPNKGLKVNTTSGTGSVIKTNPQNEQRDFNDFYDFYACYSQIPDEKCRIRSDNNRCKHLVIEHTEGTAAQEKYRYFCVKGCFDYLSNTKLH